MSTMPLEAKARRIDVSNLPDCAMDHHDPLWWGNLLMMFIETTSVVLVLAGYYYVRRNYTIFPPPRFEAPVMFDTTPDRHAATANTILLVGSCALAYLFNQAARRNKHTLTTVGMAVMTLVGCVSLWLTWKEFPSIHFSWGDNAYASICWVTIGLHFIYILGGIGEYLLLFVWLLTHDMDQKHDLDVTLVGGYWYWVAAIWIPIYVTIWWSPTFLR